MNLSISDGVGERLSSFLEALGKHLWDSRQRASFAMYVMGLLSELLRKSVESIATLFATTPEEADVIHQRLLIAHSGQSDCGFWFKVTADSGSK
jgi:SRSO17 transposase